MVLLPLVLALHVESAAAACTTANYYIDTDADGYGTTTPVAVRCVRTGGYPGFSLSPGDCNDRDATVSPGATEVCNRKDDDCDASIDEPGGSGIPVWYADADADGYGTSTSSSACARPRGYAALSGDCLDTAAAVSPAAVETCNNIDDNCDGLTDPATSVGVGTWYTDADNDGYGTSAAPVVACTQPAGTRTDTTDCNDAAAAISPIAAETCNGLDDNCDGLTDPATAAGAITWYADTDGDGYGAPGATVVACSQPGGYSASSTDCDDGSPSVSPGVAESCNGLDDNCDGVTDPSTATGATTWYTDTDGDGYGDPATATLACTQPAGTVSAGGDCNDSSAAVSPAAVESCNGIDDDCNGVTDPTTATGAATWYTDADDDGYGNASAPAVACVQPIGTVANAIDCNDTDTAISPVGVETCNGIDDNCDGVTDPSTSVGAPIWYADIDGDTYGDPASVLTPACSAPSYAAPTGTDCDDTSAAVYPGALDVCNGIDDDCDGVVDPTFEHLTWYADIDGDGHGDPGTVVPSTCGTPSAASLLADDCDDLDPMVSPDEAEACNGIDDDCDGETDPGSSVDAETWFADLDGDGFGDPASIVTACTQPAATTADSSDCNDVDGRVYPTAVELCNGRDDDCDGLTDPSTSANATLWYLDADHDTFGAPDSAVASCAFIPGTTTEHSDCDDEDATLHDECYTVAYGDLHNHSNLSMDGCEDENNQCLPAGFYPGEEAYARAAEQGMSFGAVTDHAEHLRYQRPADGIDVDIWAWAQALVQEAEGGPVIPILGYEYTAPYGHRTVLFDGDEACPAYRKSVATSRNPKDVFGLETYTDNVDSGYLTSAAFVAGMQAAGTSPGCSPVRWISYYHHPAYKPPGEVKWSLPSIAQTTTDTVVEIASEHGSSECYNLAWPGCDFRVKVRSYSVNGSVQRALQLGYRLGFVGGSDNHQTNPALFADGGGYIGHLFDRDGDGIQDSPETQFGDGAVTGAYIEGPISRTAVFDAIDARHTVATTWPFDGLKLHAVNASGMVYLPGDDVPISGGPLTLQIDLTDPTVSSWYFEVVNPTTGAVSTSSTITISDGVPRYVRLRATVAGVEERLWASPFFPS